MTVDETPPELTGNSVGRNALGVVLAAVTIVVAICYGIALWNPWQLVVLDEYFGNPLFGLFAVSAGTYAVFRLLLPVRNEAVQRVRLRIRAIPIVTGVLGLILWGMLGTAFNYEHRELVRSEDGERAVGLVTHERDERQHVHVWEGRGLLTRDVGDLGRVCGAVEASFVTNDLIEIQSHRYDPWQIELDPATAEPQQRLGPRCPDPPEPID